MTLLLENIRPVPDPVDQLIAQVHHRYFQTPRGAFHEACDQIFTMTDGFDTIEHPRGYRRSGYSFFNSHPLPPQVALTILTKLLYMRD